MDLAQGLGQELGHREVLQRPLPHGEAKGRLCKTREWQLETHHPTDLLAERGAGKTICPSEAARAVAGSDERAAWEPLDGACTCGGSQARGGGQHRDYPGWAGCRWLHCKGAYPVAIALKERNTLGERVTPEMLLMRSGGNTHGNGKEKY